MRAVFAGLWLCSTACGSAGPAEIPEPGPRAAITAPTALLDFVPESLGGIAATNRGGSPDRASATYVRREVTVTLEAARMTDAVQTRASFELLGLDVTSRSVDHELRGLRVQGNPGQLTRQLQPPHRATLTVVAANTYLVTLSVEPASNLDIPLAWVDQVDVGGMTRLALAEHKAAGGLAPAATAEVPPAGSATVP
jgi:hypothetical protein